MKRIFLLPLLLLGQLFFGAISAQANIGSSPAIDQLNRLVFTRTVDVNSELVIRDATNPSIDVLVKAIDGRIFSSPVIGFDDSVHTMADGGDIYVASLNGVLYKFDQNLNEVWQFNAGSAVYSTVAISPIKNGKAQLFFGNKDGVVFSVNSIDGTKNWQLETGFEIGGNAVLWPLDNSLSIANASGEVFVIDQATGAINAQYTVPDRASVTTPVLAANGDMIIATFNGDVIRVARDGTQKWLTNLDTTLGSKFIASPVIDKNGNIYVADYESGTVFSLTEDGQRNWPAEGSEAAALGSKLYGSPLLIDDAGTTKLVVSGFANQGNKLIDDMLIFSQWYEIHILDITTGSKQQTIESDHAIYSALNLGSGNLITINSQSEVISFSTNAIIENSPWPSYQMTAANTGMQPDTDGDGCVDSFDLFINDANECFDTDGDTIGNNADTDDDNDGVLDINDDLPLNFGGAVDTDGDGKPDNWLAGCDTQCQNNSGLILDLDDDNDGMSDEWEEQYNPGSSLIATDGYGDTDGDGLTDFEEHLLGSNPVNQDTDEDGLTDYAEQNTLFCELRDQNDECVNEGYADLFIADTDGDGLKDGFEAKLGFDPKYNFDPLIYKQDIALEDLDGDQYDNKWEQDIGTDPRQNEFDDIPLEYLTTSIIDSSYVEINYAARELKFSPDGRFVYYYLGSTPHVSTIDEITGEWGSPLASDMPELFTPNAKFAVKRLHSNSSTFSKFAVNEETGVIRQLQSRAFTLSGAVSETQIVSMEQGSEQIRFVRNADSQVSVISYEWDQETGKIGSGTLVLSKFEGVFAYGTGITSGYFPESSLDGSKLYLRNGAEIKVLDYDGSRYVETASLKADQVLANIGGGSFYDVKAGLNGEFYISSSDYVFKGGQLSEEFPSMDSTKLTINHPEVSSDTGLYIGRYSNLSAVVQTDAEGRVEELGSAELGLKPFVRTYVHPNGVWVYALSAGSIGQELSIFKAGYFGKGHPDIDEDGMRDIWEHKYGLDPLNWNDGNVHNDSDSLNNLQESLLATDPFNADTDGDTVNDDADAFPLMAAASIDTDGDGKPDDWNDLSYCDVVCRTESGLGIDTDKDGDDVLDVNDAFELDKAASIDFDNDGQPDNWHALSICDAVCRSKSNLILDMDDDNDDVDDVADDFPLNKAASLDTDGDGRPNDWNADCYETCQLESGLTVDNDDDNDGLADSEDSFPIHDSPDIDDDGLDNEWEVLYAEAGFDPIVKHDVIADYDQDGLADVLEYQVSNPTMKDTDGDELWDDYEVKYGFDASGFLDLDTDKDPDGDLYHNAWEHQMYRDRLEKLANGETLTTDIIGNPLLNEFDDIPLEYLTTSIIDSSYVEINYAARELKFSPDGRFVYYYLGSTPHVSTIDEITGEWGSPLASDMPELFTPNAKFAVKRLHSNSSTFSKFAVNEETGVIRQLQSRAFTLSGAVSETQIVSMEQGSEQIRFVRNADSQVSVISYEWDQETGKIGSGTLVLSKFEGVFAYGTGITSGYFPESSLDGSKLYLRNGAEIKVLDYDGSRYVETASLKADQVLANIGGGSFYDVKAGLNGEFYISSSDYVFKGGQLSEEFPSMDSTKLTINHPEVSSDTGLYIGRYSNLSAVVQTDAEGRVEELGSAELGLKPFVRTYVHPNGVWVYALSAGSIGQELSIFKAGYFGKGHPDTDGDGVRDLDDAFMHDPTEQYDSDGDGIGNNADAFPYDIAASVDTDGDGMPNDWNPECDFDCAAQSPLIVDDNDDNDDHLDADDAFPLDANEWLDTDLDGIGNNADLDDDDDGMSDVYETNNGLNALDESDRDLDLDGDGLSNYEESELGTLANNTDSDGDSIPDGWEVTYGLDPTLAADGLEDWDSDGHSNANEYIVNTSPLDPRWYPGAPGLKKWGFDSGDKVRSSMAFGPEGQAYFVNDAGVLFAIDSDGGEIWQFDTGAQVASSPAIGLEGEIYYTDMNGDLTAVTNNGDELWTFTVAMPITTTPVVGDNGVVFFGADDGVLYAVDVDGSEKWSYETDDAIKSSARIDKEGVLHFGSDDGSVYAVHSESGMEYRP